MNNECETPNKGVKAYFQTISLGLKVYYSRKEALNIILEDVSKYPCLIVSPLNTFQFYISLIKSDIINDNLLAFDNFNSTLV